MMDILRDQAVKMTIGMLHHLHRVYMEHLLLGFREHHVVVIKKQKHFLMIVQQVKITEHQVHVHQQHTVQQVGQVVMYHILLEIVNQFIRHVQQVKIMEHQAHVHQQHHVL